MDLNEEESLQRVMRGRLQDTLDGLKTCEHTSNFAEGLRLQGALGAYEFMWEELMQRGLLP